MDCVIGPVAVPEENAAGRHIIPCGTPGFSVYHEFLPEKLCGTGTPL